MTLCISVLSVVISPFSFLIFFIWFFSLCFLMSLDNGLSVLFIFSGNLRLALLIFAMILLVSFVFISALIFKIYFLLPTLRFFISPFLVALGVGLGYLFDFFSCFLRYACIAMNFPLSTAFIVSHRFWVVVFSFPLVSMNILISFLFLLWFVGYSEACCSASICWNF